MGQRVAIITARGGSKRIPGKNIRNFCGKPILAYSIEAAQEAEIFDEIMVSTEDSEIAELAEYYGAKIPFLRSEKNSGDYAATADVLTEVLHRYQKCGREFQYGCCIYPTAPFVTGKKLRDAMELLEQGEAESVIPVTAFSFPPLRGIYIENGTAKYAFPGYEKKRSQDIPVMYHDCGQFYCFQVDKFLKHGMLVTERTKALVMPELEVQDIDNEQDWKLAEIKFQLMRKEAFDGSWQDRKKM